MTTITEKPHAFAFILSKEPGNFSLDNVTILSGENLDPGTVLGKTVTAGSIEGAPWASNTGGSGGISAFSVGGAAIEGVYKVLLIEPGSDAGTFIVHDPHGRVVGRGAVPAAFTSEHINFTIADLTDFVAGDGFDVKVSQLTRKWKALDPAATDGSNRAAGILCAEVNASAGDRPGVALTRKAEVNAWELIWPVGISAADESIAASQLRELGIVPRF